MSSLGGPARQDRRQSAGDGWQALIRGTRITVDLILELLAAGMEPEEIAEDYKISVEDVRAALLYAARVLGREEVLIAPEA